MHSSHTAFLLESLPARLPEGGPGLGAGSPTEQTRNLLGGYTFHRRTRELVFVEAPATLVAGKRKIPLKLAPGERILREGLVCREKVVWVLVRKAGGKVYRRTVAVGE